MRKILIGLLLLCYSITSIAQGKLVRHEFTAASLQNNKGGEDPLRQLTVYLPADYEKGTQRYPVIYVLHGYGGTDSVMMSVWINFKKLLDEAIKTGKMRPMIVVAPNSNSKLQGSFYTNSSVTGNWADYIGKDVVEYMDKNFRTIPDRKSRGLCGHSMGGNGALKLGMLFADTFSAVYALSPAVLNWYGDFTLRSGGFKRISKLNNIEAIVKALNESDKTGDFDAFFAAVLTAMARVYSPNAANKELLADFPVTYVKDSAVYDPKVIAQWEAQFPFYMIDDYLPQLRSLTALKLDWGRNEEFSHIPYTSLQFSKKLEGYRIKHFAEEYIGDHGNMLDGFDGRIFNELLPFFDKYLYVK
ncbi:alpha/beta hydrolase [Lacibacter sediminis]|uniref:Esterase family protein n=1 Tax=Lacibacter sediminis TaxID=2760713 RepID=A0A7G5XIN9_9BACT|nr:alpha/beta hydrolase-fold protein [Lacibacter sediminis]QNA45342.1 esterase family protein [Lacibacter sediminis]